MTGQFDRWFAGRDSGYAVQQMNLEWVAPNAAFDPAKVGAAPGPYRLAWVAERQAVGRGGRLRLAGHGVRGRGRRDPSWR